MSSSRIAPLDNSVAWRAQWAVVTAGAAVVMTLVDAALLQRRRTYFTGGFLSVDHVTTLPQATGFVFGSLMADAAVLGMFTAIALWMAARLGLARKPAMTVAFVLALTPLVIADFIAYQLLTFLGDAFDFGLMFDLAGRNPAEILAVSSSHAGWALLVVLSVVIALVAVVVAARRFSPSAESTVEPVPLRRAVALSALLLVVGMVGTATLRTESVVIDNGLRRKPTGRLLGLMVTTVSDVDRDGFGLLGRPGDPNPFNAAIRPWAVDLPGNGIDENGVAGDLPATTEPYVETGDAFVTFAAKPDVIMFVLEGVRADAVGASVDGKAVTPVLDSLAARGISASHAYSHNGYTVQSRRHIFSGSVADLRGTSTLLDDFKGNGYQTAYFSGQDESFGDLAHGVGFERADVSYDARADVARRYSTFTTAGSLAVPYDVVVEKVRAFLADRRPDRPLFLYINFHDTHFPYHHRTIFPLLASPVLTQFEIRPDAADGLRAMYLNTVANIDRAIGEVLDHARRSLGVEPGVIVLSDHGESLFDEGFLGHGYALNDAQTRIPLIVANLPLAISEPFGQADLRDLIRGGFEGERTGRSMPSLIKAPTRAVFQYLGAVDRPAQISLTSIDGRVIYDFRTNQAQIKGSGWRYPSQLSAKDSPRFLELVYTWERMSLARHLLARAN